MNFSLIGGHQKYSFILKSTSYRKYYLPKRPSPDGSENPLLSDCAQRQALNKDCSVQQVPGF
jgi:hypothetical protein